MFGVFVYVFLITILYIHGIFMIYIMEKKRGIFLKLSEEDIAFLETRGGKTKAIKSLIGAAKKGEEKKEEGIESKFWNKVITPSDHHLQETYETIIESYIVGGQYSASIEYFRQEIVRKSGLDEKTIIKHLRTLVRNKYIAFQDMPSSQQAIIRPTLRLVKGTTKEEFKDIYIDFGHFLRKEEDYVDFLE